MEEEISKLADKEGTYSFCISTNHDKVFNATIQIETGLQQANFDYLPSQNDH